MLEKAITQQAPRVPGPAEPGRERFERLARDSRAPATWKAYLADWRVWTEWATQHGVIAMPAASMDVALFLSAMSEHRKTATLKRYLASVSVMHSMKGYTFERRAPDIRTIMKGIARSGGSARKVQPVMADQLQMIMGSLGNRLIDRRDAALLGLGFVMAARRSELAGLDWMVRGVGSNGTGALEVSGIGATVRLFNSKTKQGQEDSVYIQPGPALRAVRDWVVRAGLTEGAPLLRAVTPRGQVSAKRISDRTIARIIKRRCEAIGLDPKLFGGHSLRAGLVTSAFELGLPDWKIRLTTRHSEKSRELDGYFRPGNKRKHALTNALGF